MLYGSPTIARPAPGNDLPRKPRAVVVRFRTLFGTLWALVAVAWLAVPPTFAQDLSASTRGQSPRVGSLPLIVGPPAPVAPAMITRDDAGRATVRATRLSTPIKVDGRLDEPIYKTTLPISDFIQNDPHPGEPATEKTEVWLFFDRDNFYVVARCWESDPSKELVNEMRRDSGAVAQNDGFSFGIDPFYDHRNALVFDMNALGGRIDGQVTNERQVNLDWNPVWNPQVARFEGGWTVEAAVPFKSLRYQAGREQVWGFNARRVNRWKNEVSYITKIPSAMTLRGHFLSSLMATMVGLEAPPASRNIELKPFVIANLTTDATVAPKVLNDPGANVGGDMKFAISQGITGDVTVNTDFAQVEADEAQVNLTRFSLFFPEKREFFLENQGTFGFGGAQVTGTSSGGSGQGANAGAQNDTPILFYSRRIGLNNGRSVPIDVGGRATGRLGRYSLGVLDIQAGDVPETGTGSTNFSALRLRRDLLRKSTVGVIYTGRSLRASGAGGNEVYGVDGAFAFYDNLNISTYWAKTSTDGLVGGDDSHRAQLDYNGDRYGVQLERLVVGRNFNPELGFVRRGNMERSFAQLRFSPRVARWPSVRRVFGMGSAAYIENTSGRLETRDLDAELAIEYQNGDRPSLAYSRTYEFLPRPFAIATGVTLPSDGYSFGNARAGYTLGPRRRVSGTLAVEHGEFYNGRKTSYSWTRGRVFLTPRISVEPRFSIDRVQLVEGRFTSTVVGNRATFTATPLMFVSALVQYSSAARALSANVRLRWEYRPGSEFFIVWNEQRDTIDGRYPLANRALIVKATRLFRF